MRITLSRALYALAKAVSKDVTRPSVQYILVESLDDEGHGVAIATDGRVLLRTPVVVSSTKGYDPPGGRLLTADGLEGLKKLVGAKSLHTDLKSEADPITAQITDKLTGFKQKSNQFTVTVDTSHLKDQKFPDWRHVWPDYSKAKSCIRVYLSTEVLQILIDARKAMPNAQEKGIEFYIPPESSKGYVSKGVLIRMPCPGGPIEGIVMPMCPDKGLEAPKKELQNE